jgi:hypothetical protein
MAETRATLPDVVAMDSQLGQVVARIISASSLVDHVEVMQRPSMVSSIDVYEFHANKNLPVYMWSSGEIQLWTFICSLAGQAEVNLAAVSGYIGRPVAAHLLVAMGALLGFADGE